MTSGSLRLPWVDHLRAFVIILVVNVHACVTYSHVGSWYYMSDYEPTLRAKLPFILWESSVQSFFMGLLFFVAGYFAHASLVRRGPAAFVRERLFRLGLPALLYMLVIHPFILLGLNPWHAQFGPPLAFYAKFLSQGRVLSASGPLWFAVALLIFCVIFAGFRTVWPAHTRGSAGREESPAEPPSGRCLGLFAAGLGVTTFAVRLGQPLGTNVFNLQLCYFAQYVAFFAAGVASARQGWFLTLPSAAQSRRAGWLAFAAGPLVLLGLIAVGSRFGPISTFTGGWHWQAFALAVWEQLTGVGFALGLLAVFARYANRETAAAQWLSQRAFGVYVLHAPVLVALTMAYRSLPPQPIRLALLLTVSGLVVSYALVDAVRRIPGLRAIL